MYTVEQLRSGDLSGIKRLKLSEALTELPVEILSLADSLEILDLSDNKLSDLPESLSKLKKLKIIFASNNSFQELPRVLGRCPNLEMVGFKSNKIRYVPAESLPEKLRWLILTDNSLDKLPEDLGERVRLQKLSLAGNRLTELPHSLGQLVNLELVRISANRLVECPDQLLDLPKLAWFAFAGNPFSSSSVELEPIPKISSSSFSLHEVLGQGASGVISRASWKQASEIFPEAIAVKVFKGEVTSDGYPKDELQSRLKVGNHHNLVRSLAQVNEPGCLALVMELIEKEYKNLGLPPDFNTCTRDTFAEGFCLSIETIDKIVNQMADVFEHIHQHKVCHGDLYAHNTLFNDDGKVIFGDFGAASIYSMLSDEQQQKIKAIEYRALKYFIDDLLNVCEPSQQASPEYQRLKALTDV